MDGDFIIQIDGLMNEDVSLCRIREMVGHDPELVTLQKITVDCLKALKEDNIQETLFHNLIYALQYSYMGELTQKTVWELQQHRPLHVVGGNMVENTMDGFYSRFIRGLDIFYDLSP